MKKLVQCFAIATLCATAISAKASGTNAGPMFAGTLDRFCSSRGLDDLESEHLAEGTLEARIWIGFGRGSLECIQLKRNGFIWSGHYYRDGINMYPAQNRIVRPLSGWTDFWKRLNELGFLTLPDSQSLKGEKEVFDGESCVVEILIGSNYRTYEYSNPSEQPWQEAKKMVEILKVLRDELALSRKMPNQSTDPTP